MKVSASLALLGLLGLSSGFKHQLNRRNHAVNEYYTLELDPRQAKPQDVAARLGLRYEGQLGEIRDVHIFSMEKSEVEEDVVNAEIKRRRRKRSLDGRFDPLDAVGNYHKQRHRSPWAKRYPPMDRKQALTLRQSKEADAAAIQRQTEVTSALDIKDPIFNEQWHLFNTIQVGHDVNVTDVWLSGVTGKNATVAIVDDGLDMDSDDLKDNYYAAGSYDFNDKGPDPKPRLSDDRHGTRCAGEVAAVRNNVCGVGVAYDSNIAGIRILSKIITDEDEAVALNYDYLHNQVYSCSWGPPDDGKSMDAPNWIIKKAMLNGVQNGREGLGSIFVFASGNGAQFEDNCNFDGYTNSIYSITVGAIDRAGEHPYYSEKCSAQLVVAYSSGGGDAIHTTDVGTNACYNGHGGTSAAAPLGAGIIALALEVRPDLTWRDMQYIVLEAAVPVDLDNPDLAWQTTAIGKKFSHSFGYGKLDAWRLVDIARTWEKVKPQSWLWSPWIHVNQDIPQGQTGLQVDYEVTEQMMKDANLARLEHITITMNAEHTRRGDMSVDLISPSGVVSHIATNRKLDSSKEGYADWTFMTVAHWGEDGIGTWSIVIKDIKENKNKGKLVDFHLKFWGEAIDADKTTLLPMPTEDEDADHTVIPTSSATGVSTSVSHATDSNFMSEKPTDHPDRPTKPSDTAAETTPTGTEEEAVEETTSSSWVPSFLPTFGASPHTVAWIYGSLALIVVFCAGLGAWLFVVRRRRLRNSGRGDYEFELIDDEEAEGLASGEKTGAAAGKRRTRGGELYDAFASDGSDDEFRDEDDATGSGSGSSGVYDSRREKAAAGAEYDVSDEEEQHVIGDDDDEDDSDDEDDRRRDAAQENLLGTRHS
ncbi:hypothetical protein MKZ38_001796 [Zalerion maritima]|uniref:P/Homo B domain-containing protein n=1 Tax=Zalerion maritima TaxID=339359 RepID=A0AAD5RZJ2_9PEZI|nr:hypothetical protein MKZ38_001796 [Zalerion maritima]